MYVRAIGLNSCEEFEMEGAKEVITIKVTGGGNEKCEER
jgi:hypothetical protein